MKTLRAVALLVAALLAIAGGGACMPVPPWQRGILMSAPMREPLTAGESAVEIHVHQTREAMAGAAGAGGVSCGCN